MVHPLSHVETAEELFGGGLDLRRVVSNVRSVYGSSSSLSSVLKLLEEGRIRAEPCSGFAEAVRYAQAS